MDTFHNELIYKLQDVVKATKWKAYKAYGSDDRVRG